MEKQALQSRLWSVVKHAPVILLAAVLGLAWQLESSVVREIMNFGTFFREELVVVTITYVPAYAVYRFGEGRFSGRFWILIRPVGAILAAGVSFTFFLAVLEYLAGGSAPVTQVLTIDGLEFGVFMATMYYVILGVARHGIGLAIPERVYQTPW